MRRSCKSVYCALVSVCRCHYQRVSHSGKSFRRERARVTRQILTESPTGFLQDALPFVRELLAKQDGGVLREGIGALSEALMGMEGEIPLHDPTYTKGLAATA